MSSIARSIVKIGKIYFQPCQPVEIISYESRSKVPEREREGERDQTPLALFQDEHPAMEGGRGNLLLFQRIGTMLTAT